VGGDVLEADSRRREAEIEAVAIRDVLLVCNSRALSCWIVMLTNPRSRASASSRLTRVRCSPSRVAVSSWFSPAM
jgi:hypothetical protein